MLLLTAILSASRVPPYFKASLLRLLVLGKDNKWQVIEISYMGQLLVHANYQPLTLPLDMSVLLKPGIIVLEALSHTTAPCHNILTSGWTNTHGFSSVGLDHLVLKPMQIQVRGPNVKKAQGYIYR